ncbi:MAG: hypothetical protein ABJA50_14270, partial [Chloroflexota bacterium]
MTHKRTSILATLFLLLTALPPQFAHRTSANILPVPMVAQRFQGYYNQYDGLRVLGNPVTDSLYVYSYPAQYFEKGRIEDHRGESP